MSHRIGRSGTILGMLFAVAQTLGCGHTTMLARLDEVPTFVNDTPYQCPPAAVDPTKNPVIVRPDTGVVCIDGLPAIAQER